MTEIDYKRSYYCLKKWVEEIQENPEEHDPEAKEYIEWIAGTCENKIFNGEYLSDEEYNKILKGE